MRSLFPFSLARSIERLNLGLRWLWMVVDFFGLVLPSLSVCLPDVFLDGSNLRLVNGLFGALCYYQSSKRCCQALRGLESMGGVRCWIS